MRNELLEPIFFIFAIKVSDEIHYLILSVSSCVAPPGLPKVSVPCAFDLQISLVITRTSIFFIFLNRPFFV